jgi:hypothetical protein
MNARLQAGLELQFEKQAQQKHDSSLSGVLGQYFKQAHSSQATPHRDARYPNVDNASAPHTHRGGTSDIRYDEDPNFQFQNRQGVPSPYPDPQTPQRATDDGPHPWWGRQRGLAESYTGKKGPPQNQGGYWGGVLDKIKNLPGQVGDYIRENVPRTGMLDKATTAPPGTPTTPSYEDRQQSYEDMQYAASQEPPLGSSYAKQHLKNNPKPTMEMSPALTPGELRHGEVDAPPPSRSFLGRVAPLFGGGSDQGDYSMFENMAEDARAMSDRASRSDMRGRKKGGAFTR